MKTRELAIKDAATPLDLVLASPGPLDQNAAAVYLAGLASPTGRRTQQQALSVMADLLTGGRASAFTIEWGKLRYQHTAALRAQLINRYSPASVNKFLSALRGVLRNARRLGQMTAEEFENAADLESVVGDTLPAGRDLAAGEISALMEACASDPSLNGIRDGAIIAVMYSTGLRRAEVAALDLAHYDEDTGRLTVKGKRSKERAVYVANGAADALVDWISARGKSAGPLFVRLMYRKPSKERLTPQAIYNVLAKRAEAAAVKSFSPHDLRRTFVGDLLDAGADIATVAKIAGHANVQTTARYDRRPEGVKQKAANLLYVPYRRRKPPMR